MVCGEKYRATYAGVKRPLCSTECRAIARTRAVQCDGCGNVFRTTANKARVVKYCSHQCFTEASKVGLKSGVCPQCASVFVKRTKGQQFCSNACLSACRSESGLGGKKGVWARTQAALQKPWAPPVSDWERVIRRELSKLKHRSRPVDPWKAKCDAMAASSRHRTAGVQRKRVRPTSWDEAVRHAVKLLNGRAKRQASERDNPWVRWCNNRVANCRQRLRRKAVAKASRLQPSCDS